jgi:hypothetical protein
MLIGASGSWHAAGSRTGAGHWSSLNPRRCLAGIGRLEGLLALVDARAGRAWSAPYRERAQIAHSTCGLGEPLVGPAADPGRAGQAGVHSLGSHGRQIHAQGTRPGTIVELAKLSQTACRGYLGLRLLLRPDPMVPNPLCLFRDTSRKPRSGAYPGDPAFHGGVDGGGSWMLQMGPGAPRAFSPMIATVVTGRSSTDGSSAWESLRFVSHSERHRPIQLPSDG